MKKRDQRVVSGWKHTSHRNMQEINSSYAFCYKNDGHIFMNRAWNYRFIHVFWRYISVQSLWSKCYVCNWRAVASENGSYRIDDYATSFKTCMKRQSHTGFDDKSRSDFHSKFESFIGYEDLEDDEKEEVSQRKRDIASGHYVSLEDLWRDPWDIICSFILLQWKNWKECLKHIRGNSDRCLEHWKRIPFHTPIKKFVEKLRYTVSGSGSIVYCMKLMSLTWKYSYSNWIPELMGINNWISQYFKIYHLWAIHCTDVTTNESALSIHRWYLIFRYFVPFYRFRVIKSPFMGV